MSNVINSEDIKVKVSGKFGSLFSKTNITIGVTDKFVYKEVSQGKNSGTKIYPQTRIDSYGIEVFQIAKWFLYAITFLVVLPIAILLNDSYDWIIIELERNYLLITSIVIGLVLDVLTSFEATFIVEEESLPLDLIGIFLNESFDELILSFKVKYR